MNIKGRSDAELEVDFNFEAERVRARAREAERNNRHKEARELWDKAHSLLERSLHYAALKEQP